MPASPIAHPQQAARPYLSVVATARNDNHGGDLLRRMQLFIDGLLDQCDRHRLDAELILVEWNPPTDRPRLADVLRWPARPGRCAVRIVEVPPHVHNRFELADRLPLFQMIAKNVGLRRARGEFALATNIDILFSEEMIAHLAQRKLRPDRMYRVDRHDVASDVPLDASPAERAEWCKGHVIRVNRRDGTHDARTGEFHRIYWSPTPKVRLLEALQDFRVVPTVTRKRLHLNGCGDFTLLHRDRWAALRGYPEMAIFSMHLDSVLCTAAHFGGAPEVVLPDPMRAYHIEHAVGSGWSPEGQAKLNARLAEKQIPQLQDHTFHLWAVRMRRDRTPLVTNEETWGMVNEDLPDYDPSVNRPAAAAAA